MGTYQNKITVLFFFLLIITITNKAQSIKLQLNGTTKQVKKNLPKTMLLRYATDSSIINIKGKVIQYEFPYLLIKTDTQTIKLNVKQIHNLKYRNWLCLLNYTAAAFTTDISLLLIYETFRSGGTGFLFGSALSIATTYVLIDGAKREFNTKTEWSFY